VTDRRTISLDGMLSAPDSKASRLQRAALKLLEQHEHDGALPTNGRFLFYELEQAGVVPKAYLDEYGKRKPRQPATDVSDATMVLRRAGLVPWWWIVDETREVTDWAFAASVYDYLISKASSARIDVWAAKPAPLIICESRATKGVLERVAGQYLAPICATNGQCGGFLVTDVVPLLEGNERPVFYIGDHEVDGPADQIEANTRRYLEEHAGREFDTSAWSRIALTEKQVNATPRLRELVIEKLDRRYKPPRRYQAIECEAVGQGVLERLLRGRLDQMLPEPLHDVLEREAQQRVTMARLLKRAGRGR
jgi:hypothetical protein